MMTTMRTTTTATRRTAGRRAARAVVLAAFLALAAGCATIGHKFAVENVPQVKIGETTRADALHLFGPPWRTGLEDGRETWTYGHYRYSMFKAARTRDLVLRFDAQGRVASYTFNSTEPGDLGGAAATKAVVAKEKATS